MKTRRIHPYKAQAEKCIAEATVFLMAALGHAQKNNYRKAAELVTKAEQRIEKFSLLPIFPNPDPRNVSTA
jgi:hypothetical protein